jgi:release factor glutamine methyltransferase
MAERQMPGRADALLRAVAAALGKAGIEPRWTEARLIFELAGFDHMALIDAPARMLTEAEDRVIRAALAERLAGKPVARMRGTQDFAGATFTLSADTLEPRDDTQTLIDAVSDHLAARPNARILDIGTGTGIIAITLLRRFAGTTCVATDISGGAIKTAGENAEALGVAGRLALIEGDLFAGADGLFDLIISNPPYIPSGDIPGLAREVREHDPPAALDGGADGLDFYRRIAGEADSHLAPGGLIAVEIGHDQGISVRAVFERAGWLCTGLRADLGGRDRALLFQRR